MKIFVTGAAGFIGSHLVRRLVKEEHQVCIFVRPESDLWRLGDILDKMEILKGEITGIDMGSAKNLLKETQVFFHLAAAGVNQARQDTNCIGKSNFMGTLQVLQLASILDIRRFIYCGSCFEYGSGSLLTETRMPSPNSEYGASKTGGWFLSNSFHSQYGIPVVSVRPFSVYGPFEARCRLVPHVIMQSLRSEDINLSPGEQTRDFIYIDDIIDGLLTVMESSGLEGKTFNLSTGIETSIKDLTRLIANYFGCEHLLKFGAIPYPKNEILNLSGDPGLIKRKLGWRAKIDLLTGIERTIAWFEKNHLNFGEYKS